MSNRIFLRETSPILFRIFWILFEKNDFVEIFEIESFWAAISGALQEKSQQKVHGMKIAKNTKESTSICRWIEDLFWCVENYFIKKKKFRWKLILLNRNRGGGIAWELELQIFNWEITKRKMPEKYRWQTISSFGQLKNSKWNAFFPN